VSKQIHRDLEKAGIDFPTGYSIPKVETPLETLLSMKESIDNISSVSQLVQRAEDKLEDKVVKADEGKTLSAIKFVMKGRKGRPFNSYYKLPIKL